jgi:hypothetical protein
MCLNYIFEKLYKRYSFSVSVVKCNSLDKVINSNDIVTTSKLKLKSISFSFDNILKNISSKDLKKIFNYNFDKNIDLLEQIDNLETGKKTLVNLAEDSIVGLTGKEILEKYKYNKVHLNRGFGELYMSDMEERTSKLFYPLEKNNDLI